MKLKISLENSEFTYDETWLAKKSLKLTANSVEVFGKAISCILLGSFSTGCNLILLAAA